MAFKSWLSRPRTMRSLMEQLRLAVRLLREPRVPTVLKVLPGLAALYVVSPVDFIPDLIPGLGQFDDLAVLVFTIELFIRLCPHAAQLFHREAIAEGRPFSPMPSQYGNVIEANWTRH
ncbi:MAG TPA: YkvA family protein [Vicinamibacterales bacterium]|jgi:uncharacterized membrane protein YkvA (DUF1232 family)